jgi:hypothetical protein
MAGTNFTSFDFPGATSTLAWGINSAGQIVGIYRNADAIAHGFLAQPGNKAKPQQASVNGAGPGERSLWAV